MSILGDDDRLLGSTSYGSITFPDSTVQTTAYAGTTSNRFDFGISNTSGSTQTIYYGYTKIS